MTITMDAAVTQLRLCLCGCGKAVEARSGPGRPSVYASAECRRTVEYKARKAGRADTRPDRGHDPRDSRATLNVRVSDPVKLARQWFSWRYPESYHPAGDGRSPSGFRVILGDYPGTVEAITAAFTVKTIRGAGIEIAELARWVRNLPRYQQADFACRAVEARPGRHMMEESPDKPVRHGDRLDCHPDPVTLSQLRGFYRPGECLEAGCHSEPEIDGRCRGHYDQFRR